MLGCGPFANFARKQPVRFLSLSALPRQSRHFPVLYLESGWTPPWPHAHPPRPNSAPPKNPERTDFPAQAQQNKPLGLRQTNPLCAAPTAPPRRPACAARRPPVPRRLPPSQRRSAKNPERTDFPAQATHNKLLGPRETKPLCAAPPSPTPASGLRLLPRRSPVPRRHKPSHKRTPAGACYRFYPSRRQRFTLEKDWQGPCPRILEIPWTYSAKVRKRGRSSARR